MAKKPSVSSVRDKHRGRNGKHISDRLIDFSDIPELSNSELKRARRVGRPRTGNAKQLIAVRLDPKLLAKLRKLASKRQKPYQTLMHELLENAGKKAA